MAVRELDDLPLHGGPDLDRPVTVGAPLLHARKQQRAHGKGGIGAEGVAGREGQIEGGVMMGLGAALSEQFIVENGINLTDSLHKVRLPTADQTPEIIPVIVEVPHPFSPQGMKGFAEAPSMATAPAILNAVYDAVGVRINEIPIDKKKLRAAIHANAQQ